MRPPRFALYPVLLSLFLVFCSYCPLEAATHTWTGAGGNSLWSNAANWAGGKPTSSESGGTNVVFGSGTASVCDIVGLTVDQIHFTGGGNTLSGTTTLGLSGATAFVNILSDTGTNTIAATLPMVISGQNCFVDVVAGSLTLANNVSGTVGLRKRGAGTCTITGNNSYTGPTSVVGGVLSLNSNGSNTAVPGNLVIGDQGSSNASVILQQAVEISDTATVTVYSDGTLNLNGKGETVGTLNVYGNVNLGGASGVLVVTTATNVFDPGIVTIGDGKFTQNGPLLMSGGTFQASATGLLTLGADVTATSSSVAGAAVNSPVKLAATRTLTVNAGAVQPELTFNGVIGEANLNTGLTKKGNGTLKLESNSSNTFTGTTTVESGTVQLLANSGRIVVGSLVIGND
ncbi:MAG TPA: autotransporter-associated beta strand repeat-containing protein, partial [Verrucomicrobiales bacterium]|nr:autotransporter-associated beta strand repeat-containing protein [Verrucomicrobiales bacterium]